ncbi:hypothetical protein DICA0_A08790 [Diutina catenulata]
MSELTVLEVVYPYVDTRTQLKLLSLLKKPRYESIAQRLMNIPIAVTAHNIDIAPRDSVNIIDHHRLQGNKVAFYSNGAQMRYFDDPRFAETVKEVTLDEVYHMPELPYITKLRVTYLGENQHVDVSSCTNLEEFSIHGNCVYLRELVVPASLRRLRASYLGGTLKWPYTLPPTHLRLEKGDVPVKNLDAFLEHAWPTLEVFETDQVCKLTAPTNKPIALCRLKSRKPPQRLFRYKTPHLESIHLTDFDPRDIAFLSNEQVRRLDGISMDRLHIDMGNIPPLALATVEIEKAIETTKLEQWLTKYAPHITRLKADITGDGFKFPRSLKYLDLTCTMINYPKHPVKTNLRSENLQFLKLTRHFGDLHVDCPNLKEAQFEWCEFKQKDFRCPTLTRAKFYNSTGVCLDAVPKSIRHLEFHDCEVTANNRWHFTGDSLKIFSWHNFPSSIVDAADVYLEVGGLQYQKGTFLRSDPVFANCLVKGAERVVFKMRSVPPRLPNNVRSVTLRGCSVPTTYFSDLRLLKSLALTDVRYQGTFRVPRSLERFSWHDGDAEEIDYRDADSVKELCAPIPHNDSGPIMPISWFSQMKSLRHLMTGYARMYYSCFDRGSQQCFKKSLESKPNNLCMAWLDDTPFDMVKKKALVEVEETHQEPKVSTVASEQSSRKRKNKGYWQSRKKAKKQGVRG